MKTRLLLFSCVFFISCTQIKEYRMEKDTDELIEASKKYKGYSSQNVISLAALNSIQYKYQGADYIKFMQILRNKVLEMKKKGEDCGSIELMYIMDSDFQKIDKKSE